MMKRLLFVLAIVSAAVGCAATKDLARTLRYADNKYVGVDKIQFIDLAKMKRGTACTLNLFYVIPVYGDGSIITAADNGKINNVAFIGETGWWYFIFSKNCTVVFGDSATSIQNRKSDGL